MRASAHLAVTCIEQDRPGPTRTRISRLRSDPPLVLRPVNPVGPEPLARWGLPNQGAARVALVAGAAGPVGGDQLRLDVDVGPGAALILRAVAATVVLPGPHGLPSHSQVTIHVAAGATLVWLPGPVIAAHGCDHQALNHIALDDGARLLVREELVLGRHGETPGSIRQRLRLTLAGRALYDQELHLGPNAPGWDGPAVTGGRRALGSILVVDPIWGRGEGCRPRAVVGADAARLPLHGPAVLLTALGSDALMLRRRLDTALTELETAAPCRTRPAISAVAR